MLAAHAIDLEKIRCEEILTPKPKPGEVLVKTKLASICGSDLHIVNMGWNAHKFPLDYGYPGHEGVGEVVDGSNTKFLPGDKVLTVPNIFQSKTFAGYQLVNPRFLLKLPDETPWAHSLMAQQLGTVVFSCLRIPSLLGQTVAVIGQGSAGLFHDFMLRKLGAQRIIAIEPIRERLQAGIRIGVEEAVEFTGDRATEAVLDLTNGQGVDVVVEAVGSVETLNQALQLARPFGHVVAFGLPTTMERIPFDWDTFFRRRLTLKSVCGAQDEEGLPAFQLALDYISTKQIDVTPFVTHKFPIERIQEAFNLASSKEQGALKVSLTF